MAIEHSRNAVVKVGGGQSPTETYTSIGAQTDFNLALNAGRIDVSNKTTLGWAQAIADLREFSVRVGARVNWPDTLGVDRVKDQAVLGNDISIRAVLNAAGDNYQAETQVTDMEFTAPNRDATGFNATFVLSQGTPLTDVSP